MTRRIRVYNTVGQNNKVIESGAGTWGELQKDLNAHGISYDGMRVVVGETQNTLESSQAALPEGEITLLLMTKKVKSGSHGEVFFDEVSGIGHHEVDWTREDAGVEEYDFKTPKDLALARLAKAQFYIREAESYFRGSVNKTSGNPELDNLQRMAAQIQANINIFE